MTVRSTSLCGRFSAALLLPFALFCAGPGRAKGAADFDAKAYAVAVAKAEAGDPGVDYLWLRKQASAQLSYVENNWAEWQHADALVDTQPEEALRLARVRMSGVWTDFMAHIVAQLAYEKLGKPEDAAREKGAVGAIVRSIGGGHQGTSAADAFNAVSVAEEYRVLVLLRWKSEGQALISQDGHSFDVFDVTDARTNKKHKAWFNIDAYFGKEFGLR
ncbi:MAG: hypothetical protein JWM65_1959 [Sphingomonas bacterium]|nr:hypothetical protein [Sphingomonas bacterium]